MFRSPSGRSAQSRTGLRHNLGYGLLRPLGYEGGHRSAAPGCGHAGREDRELGGGGVEGGGFGDGGLGDGGFGSQGLQRLQNLPVRRGQGPQYAVSCHDGVLDGVPVCE